jgi:hypothetical protein
VVPFSHAKRGGQLKQNYLKGQHGDKLNAVLSAVGYNLRLFLLNFIRCFFYGWEFVTVNVAKI